MKRIKLFHAKYIINIIQSSGKPELWLVGCDKIEFESNISKFAEIYQNNMVNVKDNDKLDRSEFPVKIVTPIENNNSKSIEKQVQLKQYRKVSVRNSDSKKDYEQRRCNLTTRNYCRFDKVSISNDVKVIEINNYKT